MFRSRKIKHIFSLILAAALLFPFNASAAVKGITTPYESLPQDTTMDEYVVNVNSTNGQPRSYHVFSQGATTLNEKSYVAIHGCAVSALTTVLTAHSPKYAHYTPTMTYQTLEKKVFGKKRWRANYSKHPARQMPVSLYGITKILSYCGIKSKYVRKFKDAKAVKQIENHLRKGKPVIIEVNNHRQTNGRISRKYDKKWATTKHTMALLGMTDTGKVIVADSATRLWSGTNQRIKFTTLSSLVHYMVPARYKSRSLYYMSIQANGGYVLVN